MFTEEEYKLILSLLAKASFGVGSSRELLIAESIAIKIKKESEEKDA